MSSGVFFTLLGLLVMVKTLIIPKKAPMDQSNRINHLRLVWFALKSPHKFVGLNDERGEPAFPWLRRDESENVDGHL